MNAKEYAEMKKIAVKAQKDEELTTDEAVRYILLLEKSGMNETLKKCQAVLREAAMEKRVTYIDTLGEVTVYEPFVRVINEDNFKREKPAEYLNIIARKAEKLHITLDDLSKDDKEKYVHFERGTAKVKVNLA